MTDQPKRYVGLDVHKNYVMVGAVNRLQEMVLPPRKLGLADFEDWAIKHLRPTDEVVLEATTNACSNPWSSGWSSAIRPRSS